MSNPEQPQFKYGAAQPGGMPYAPAPPPPTQFGEARPGIVPLRPLNIGDIYLGAWRAIWHNPAVMIGLPLLVILVASIITALLGLALNGPLSELNSRILNMNPAETNDMFRALGMEPGSFTIIGPDSVSGLLLPFVTPIVAGILAISISQSVLGNRLSFGEAWNRVKGRVGALIGWALLATLAIFVVAILSGLAIAGLATFGFMAGEGFGLILVVILTLAFGVFLLWVVYRLIFVPPIIAIERSGIKQSIRRSWELTRGHFWRIFGIYLLGSIIAGLLVSLLLLPISFLSFGLGSTAGFLVSLLRIALSTALTLIFTSGILTLLYVDTRTRAEGLHHSLISATTPNGFAPQTW
jgi:hypothetical protein